MAVVLLGFALVLPVSCGARRSTSTDRPALSPNAAEFFPYRQGWLGADSAYSVRLGQGRSLWLLGDTFIGPANATSRKQATGFIRNSIAISYCRKQNCSFHYDWAGMNGNKPNSMFSAPGSRRDWLWPLDGFVYKGTLYVAFMQMHAEGSGAFGFAYSGTQLASIRNYRDAPSQWSVQYQELNTGGSAVPGVSIVVNEGPGGNPDPSNPTGASYAYWFTVVPEKSPLPPHLSLLRLPLDQLNRAARPGNADWEYLKSDSGWSGWPGADTVVPSDAAVVINPGATEMTVRYHGATKQWMAVYPIPLDRAARYSLSRSLTGPWGPSEKLYSYPEMQPGSANYTSSVLCYAAKEHIEFEAAGQMFFTYACNSVKPSDVTENMNLYRPVAVTRPLPSS
jgi:Domain of unknown function (DUF4185)